MTETPPKHSGNVPHTEQGTPRYEQYQWFERRIESLEDELQDERAAHEETKVKRGAENRASAYVQSRLRKALEDFFEVPVTATGKDVDPTIYMLHMAQERYERAQAIAKELGVLDD